MTCDSHWIADWDAYLYHGSMVVAWRDCPPILIENDILTVLYGTLQTVHTSAYTSIEHSLLLFAISSNVSS